MGVECKITGKTQNAIGVLRIFAADKVKMKESGLMKLFGILESRLILSEEPFVVVQRLSVKGRAAGAFQSQYQKFADGLRKTIEKHMAIKGVGEDEFFVEVSEW